MTHSTTRFRLASRYALWHLLLSVMVGGCSAVFVFGLLYPSPYQAMLGAGRVFLLLMLALVVCGPLLTWILVNPNKSRRAHAVDFGLIGAVQLFALLFGLHALWASRPVVLAFEVDRLMLVTANEIQTQDLNLAPAGLQHLPWWGVTQVNTRQSRDGQEALESVDLGMVGIGPAMRPGWWLPWNSAQAAMAQRSKPLTELQQRRPHDAPALSTAATHSRHAIEQLRYLPLTSTKTREWVGLLDEQMNLVGWAEVDGF